MYTLISLSIRDIKSKYLGSLIGSFWAILHPLATILIIITVFRFAFKVQTVNDTPFSLWLVWAMIPWLYVSETILATTHSIIENSHIVKKVNFPTFYFILAKILSYTFIHLILVLILLIITLFFGYFPQTNWFQIVYFLFSSICLLTGISFLTASLSVYIKDLAQLINVFVQIGFWATPIFWNIEKLSPQLQRIVRLNPFVYITEGYRMSICSNNLFFQNLNYTLYFWIVTLLIIIIGIISFKKLSPNFADHL